MSALAYMNSNQEEFKQLTPMMQHYVTTREAHPGCVLFYRLGDFYEMFFEDAAVVSKELELTLTKKSCGLEERALMCGVPYHAAETYIKKLIARGFKVAICDQVEDPRLAKGLVRREVTRIVTPGTNIDAEALDAQKNNYIMGVFYDGLRFGLAIADVTTADFWVTEVDSERYLVDEISRYKPSEIICNEALLSCPVDVDSLSKQLEFTVSMLDSHYFDDRSSVSLLLEHFKASALSGLGLDSFPKASISAGALLHYLREIQKSDLSQLQSIRTYVKGDYMLIDAATRRNLELVETLRDKRKQGSLLGVLDKTKTAMGARVLRNNIEQPLTSLGKISSRLDAISELYDDLVLREELREYLGPIYDMERLNPRIVYQTAGPRDMLAFQHSLEMLPAIRSLLRDLRSKELSRLYEELDPLEDLQELIATAICDEPPLSSRDGGILRDGFNAEVDRLRLAKTQGKEWLAKLEAKERERTGIKNLRVKYNKVFGYYLEVTNSYSHLVPEDYQRKQTLTNAERYFTPELKELEDTILGAEDKLLSLEYELFRQLRQTVASHVSRILTTARAVAQLDAYVALAHVAQKNHFVRPNLNTKGVIDIKGGRHPVVERTLEAGQFIDNDTFLDNESNRVSIITGPNMAGKSTYMRQTALIVLMAQIGSFVPADSADIGIVDRIFTRVGASDDLASGQSTFMVEMNEVANILRNATKDSLLILDEIGRGTSTFDGLSIAWAVVEHIANKKLIGAKTLFATHYHELTELEGKLEGVHNYCIAVKENGDDIVFLRKIVPGGADRSYGIAVAKLAGLPPTVIRRAHSLMDQLMANDLTELVKNISVDTVSSAKAAKAKPSCDIEGQLSFFAASPGESIIDELRSLDLTQMTPLEALNTLNSLQTKVKTDAKK